MSTWSIKQAEHGSGGAAPRPQPRRRPPQLEKSEKVLRVGLDELQVVAVASAPSLVEIDGGNKSAQEGTKFAFDKKSKIEKARQEKAEVLTALAAADEAEKFRLRRETQANMAVRHAAHQQAEQQAAVLIQRQAARREGRAAALQVKAQADDARASAAQDWSATCRAERARQREQVVLAREVERKKREFDADLDRTPRSARPRVPTRHAAGTPRAACAAPPSSRVLPLSTQRWGATRLSTRPTRTHTYFCTLSRLEPSFRSHAKAEAPDGSRLDLWEPVARLTPRHPTDLLLKAPCRARIIVPLPAPEPPASGSPVYGLAEDSSVVSLSSKAVAAVWDPTTWTVLQHDGPDHLELR